MLVIAHLLVTVFSLLITLIEVSSNQPSSPPMRPVQRYSNRIRHIIESTSFASEATASYESQKRDKISALTYRRSCKLSSTVQYLSYNPLTGHPITSSDNTNSTTIPVRQCPCSNTHASYCPHLPKQYKQYTACAIPSDPTLDHVSCFISPRYDLYEFVRSTWPLLCFLWAAILIALSITEFGRNVRKFMTRYILFHSMIRCMQCATSCIDNCCCLCRNLKQRTLHTSNQHSHGHIEDLENRRIHSTLSSDHSEQAVIGPISTTALTITDTAGAFTNVASSSSSSRSTIATAGTTRRNREQNRHYSHYYQRLQWYSRIVGSNETEVDYIVASEIEARNRMLESSYLVGLRLWMRMQGFDEAQVFASTLRDSNGPTSNYHPVQDNMNRILLESQFILVLKTKQYVSPKATAINSLNEVDSNLQQDPIQNTSDHEDKNYQNSVGIIDFDHDSATVHEKLENSSPSSSPSACIFTQKDDLDDRNSDVRSHDISNSDQHSDQGSSKINQYSDILNKDDATISDDDEAICTICYIPFEDGDKVGALLCGHNFHTICLKIWIKQRNVCPLCLAPNIASPRFERRQAMIVSRINSNIDSDTRDAQDHVADDRMERGDPSNHMSLSRNR